MPLGVSQPIDDKHAGAGTYDKGNEEILHELRYLICRILHGESFRVRRVPSYDKGIKKSPDGSGTALTMMLRVLKKIGARVNMYILYISGRLVIFSKK